MLDNSRIAFSANMDSMRDVSSYMESNIKLLLETMASEKDLSIQNNLFKDLIKDYVKLAKKYKSLSETDPLTRVCNRLKFLDLLSIQISAAERYGHSLSVVMLDIDHFKKVNDTYGHDAGDSVLREITEIIAHNLRGPDTLARWGGEEFMILAPETDLDGAVDVAERVRSAVEKNSFTEVGRITSSFGCAQYNSSLDIDSLLINADTALYEAKEDGRNCVRS